MQSEPEKVDAPRSPVTTDEAKDEVLANGGWILLQRNFIKFKRFSKFGSINYNHRLLFFSCFYALQLVILF